MLQLFANINIKSYFKKVCNTMYYQKGIIMLGADNVAILFIILSVQLRELGLFLITFIVVHSKYISQQIINFTGL